MEFFSKDPAKQLVEVKEKLTQRLVDRRADLKNCISGIKVGEIENEIKFLSDILDQMERS